MGNCAGTANPEYGLDRLNKAPRSDSLEMQKVQPKEMIRVLGLSGSWYIKQVKKGNCDGCMACPSDDSFRLGSNIDGSSDMYFGKEQSGSAVRCCCVNSRYWTTRVYYGAAADAKEVLLIERPCRLPAFPCKCCCLQTVSITDVQNEKKIGTVTEQCYLGVPMYTVKDGKGEDVFDIHQPTCCCNCCVNCCDSKASCCCRIPFNIYYPGTDRPIGEINKIWKNFFAELASDDDTFRFIGPDVRPVYNTGHLNLGDLDKKAGMLAQEAVRDAKQALGLAGQHAYHYDLNRIPEKSWEQGAQLLGATLLINNIYFES